MFSRFFIDRPIFASVLSILITLAGGIAVFNLPIAQFPSVTPPTVQVTCNYPGASARDVADAVAVPLEQQVNGVEGMMYMSSACTNDGTYNLTVTFRHGIDLDMAQVLVQNRVSLAIPLLPDVIKQTGVTVRKQSPDILMGFAITSPDGSYDQLYLSNYTIMQLKDELSRVEGVADVKVLGQRDYSMRIWVDPGKLAARGLTAMDVARAIREENNQVAVGQIGQPPAGTAQQLQVPLDTLGRLDTVEQFENIILKADRGRFVRLKDVTRDTVWRITLDDKKLFLHQIKGEDVVRALKAQGYEAGTDRPLSIAVKNATRELTSGQIKETPVPAVGGKAVSVADLINTLEEEVGVELGARNQDIICRFNRQSTAFLAVFQTPDANALEVRDRLINKMDELKKDFPRGVDYSLAFDTTPYTRESINEVFKTLRDAIILVAVVVLLFLQNWRSALIPLAAVPVAIIGTFAVMAGFGFSLNNLTLFGLVLAIGIVVDDAIVVVEAVEHHIEHGMSPREATVTAMEQVSGPVIAVGLVLSAVFIPCAFIAGITGQFFRQFALTIAVSTLLSAFNSLTLSPALCALLLKPRQKGAYDALPRFSFVLAGAALGWLFLAPLLGDWLGQMPPVMEMVGTEQLPLVALGLALAVSALAGWFIGPVLGFGLGWFFAKFNQGFEHAAGLYTRVVGMSLRVSALVLLLYGGMLALTYIGFSETPKGFIPSQDKGYLLVNVQLPDSASVGRTQEVMAQIEKLAARTPGVRHTVAIAGQSLLLNANAPNFGAMYVMLDDFHDRTEHDLSADAISARLLADLQAEVKDGVISVFGAPPVDGLGTAGGFKVVVEDRGSAGLETLQDVSEGIVEKGRATPGLRDAFSSFRANTPWLYLDIDRSAARAMGVPMGEVFNTLQVYLGSLYVNDFNRFGRTWQVIAQAKQDYRQQVEDLRQMKVRNEQGRMVPFGSITKFKEVTGPVMLTRYNMYAASAINSNPAPGVSSGQAIGLMEEVTKNELTPSMRYEWTELALLQLQTGNTAMWVFLLAVVLVFLVLAAQYESWALPLAVILVVPMCLLCSVAGVLLAHMDINIFTQVGFIVLVGLACKNAILIVEFAKSRREAGVSTRQATLEACRLRLRPIMMTSFAFILGVVPLVIAEGAGAEMRRTLGTAVFAGMLGVTLFGIFLTPVFYFVIQWLADRRAGWKAVEPQPEGERPTGITAAPTGH